jgi:hypothetical protein
MITYSKASRHNANIDNLDIFGSPDSIDGLAAMKECRSHWNTRKVTHYFTHWNTCKVTHYFTHIQSFPPSESLAELLAINIRIYIYADYQTIPCSPPLLQL